MANRRKMSKAKLTSLNCPACGSGPEVIPLILNDEAKGRYRCIACQRHFIWRKGKEEYEKFMGLPYLVEVTN